MKIDPIIMKILQYEKQLREKYPKDPIMWAWDPILLGIPDNMIRKLLNEGIIIRTFLGYKLTNYDELIKIVERNDNSSDDERDDKKDEIKDILDKGFSLILGYDDVKQILYRSVKAVGHHILFVGAPATAKTLFLDALSMLPKSYKINGESATKAGIEDILIDNDVRYLIIDEIEKMDTKHLTILLNIMESQRLVVTKHGKRFEKDLNINVYAAGNNIDKLQKKLPELKSRFMIFNFRPYTTDELRKVYKHILTQLEGLSDDISDYIANKLVNMGFDDPRDAKKIARLLKDENGNVEITDKKEIDKLLSTWKKYEKNGNYVLY